MKTFKRLTSYFTKMELLLWAWSNVLIIFSFFFFKQTNFLTLGASLIGVSSLIFSAKGNPIGQVLMIIFSLFYGIISFSYHYYGEVLTYLGMTMPMALIALVSWLKHPYAGKHSEVRVNHIHGPEFIVLAVLTPLVTYVFYLILVYFKTAHIVFSTLSVSTTFIAVYLTFRRSSYFTIAYAVNDLVLIVLWGLASIEDLSYLSVVVCFVTFLVNDLYGFYNWRIMAKRQTQ